MKRRVFWGCLALSLALLLFLLVPVFFLLRDTGTDVSALLPIALGACMLALIGSLLVTLAVLLPLRRLDPAHPEKASVYPELAPLLTRLGDQGKQVRAQSSELRSSRTRFDTLTAHMSEGMIILDDRAEILSCNPAACRLFGLREGEIPRNLLSLRATPAFRAAVRAALSGQNGYEVWHTGERYYSMLVTPIGEEGAVEGAVLMLLDVTEREERERLRREFTANVSHELKTPLTSISGFAELIAEGIATEADSRRFAASIQREAGRLITLVGDIIHLSQIDGGEIPFDEAPVDLHSAATEVLARLASVAEAQDVTLSLSGTHESVAGNAQLIGQMLYNLVENGIRYNRPGGFVRVRVERNGDRPTVLVTDNGIGIPSEAQPRVFERFFRVDKSHSKAIGGTGLGLSIVKHTAACHGALISLKSEEGSGTEITLSFPPLNTDLT